MPASPDPRRWKVSASRFEAIANIAIGLVFLGIAALAAYGAWFMIDDAVGDWVEAHGPQSSDQPQLGWFYGCRQTGGFYNLLLFLPSIGFAVPGCILLYSAIRHFRLRANSNS